MSCPVCCERFNKSTHATIKCPYCPFESCSTCYERYLCDTVDDAHCMSCRKGWSREVLCTNFSKKFVTSTYKERRENLLLEREKSLMPATQPYVEIEKQIRKINTDVAILQGKMLIESDKWQKMLTIPLGPLAVEHGVSTEYEASIIRHKLASEQRKAMTSIQVDIEHLTWHLNTCIVRMNGKQVEQERRAFVRACPWENCRGFLSPVWKCGMCDNWTCPECHEVKGPTKDGEHTCDPNNVATAQLLAKDSRNCPKCAAMIFKINGCDQMWCTQCHTAFSWRTGRVETHVVHNPHYFEYQRAHGTLPRQPGDVPCGGFPEWVYVARLINRSHPSFTRVANAFRSHGHCQWAMIPRYTVNVQNDNRDLRIKLMIGDLPEDMFKKKIQQREKARQRKTDIRQVLEMYMAVLNDLFQTFVSNSNVGDLVTSLEGLKNHVNPTLRAVSARYTNCAVPLISELFVLN